MILPDEIAKTAIVLKDEYFDFPRLSAYSKLGVSTLREYIRKKGLPGFKMNGKILIKRSEFDTWMERFRMTKERNLESLADDVIKDVKAHQSDCYSDGHKV